MSLYQNDIQGNANVSRSLNVGSHLNVNGDGEFGHNLRVKGWLDAPNIKGPLKGLYATEAALNAAYPHPEPGWFALVGNTLPANVYRAEAGDDDKIHWTATGEKGGEFSLYLDRLETDVKDLTDDVRDLEEMLDNGLLLAETIAFTSTDKAASMTYTVLKRDGTTKAQSRAIPIVTAEKAGMMSAADKRELTAATTAIASINEKIKALETTTTNLKTSLENEIKARENADKDLESKIAAEAQAREQADMTEATIRQGADSQLQSEIDAEKGEREGADSRLQSELESEKEARITLAGLMSDKVGELEAKDSELHTAIDTEKGEREAADKDLESKIAAEAQAREQADEAHQTLIEKLRKDFDTLVGENASEAIDNFTEVLAFLDGLKDTEKLSTKLADLSGEDAKQAGEILELQEAVWPLSASLTATPTLIKAGAATNVRLAWKAERKGRDVTEEADVALDGVKRTGKSMDTTLTLGHGETKKATLTATFEGLTESASASVRGSHPSYFGTVGKTWEASEASIKALTEILAGERSLTRNGISTNDGRIALAYPKDFGALTSIKDGNGYEVLPSYTRSETNVNGIEYYLYLLSVPVTASGVTQIYK